MAGRITSYNVCYTKLLRSAVRGPLLFLEQVFAARLGEAVTIIAPDGRRVDGEVLKISEETVVVQVLGETFGLDTAATCVSFIV